MSSAHIFNTTDITIQRVTPIHQFQNLILSSPLQLLHLMNFSLLVTLTYT